MFGVVRTVHTVHASVRHMTCVEGPNKPVAALPLVRFSHCRSIESSRDNRLKLRRTAHGRGERPDGRSYRQGGLLAGSAPMINVAVADACDPCLNQMLEWDWQRAVRRRDAAVRMGHAP